MNVLATIDFHDSITNIKDQLKQVRKDKFEPDDRIVIVQSSEDEYLYIDAPGSRIIEIQQLLDQLDITNCFVIYDTHNPAIAEEINEVVKHYSYQDSHHKYTIRNEFYNKQVKRYENTSCTKLWNHLYISPEGNSNACCVADPRFPVGTIDNPRKHSLRLKEYTQQGYRIRTCKKCYQDEDAGLRSLRTACNYTTNTADTITSLDIRISNLCNFKCRMCSEEYSSAIQSETAEIYGSAAILGNTQFSLERSSIQQRRDSFAKIKPYITNSVEHIYFAGGEPLLIDEHYKILDHLLEIGNNNIKISYNTNLSKLTFKKQSIFNWWDQFKNITVSASIDCSGAAAEYTRHGTVWSDIKHNIQSIIDNAPHVNLKFSSVVSFLSLESLINLQKDLLNQNFAQSAMLVTTLTHPNFLSVAALPNHHKQRLTPIVKEHINFLGNSALARQWESMLQYMNNYDYSYSLTEFKQRMQVLDKHRSESFVDVFPQFADLYD